jgi:CheY-like chemotaxis protein
VDLARVLVVDGSRLGREGLEIVLGAHVEQVLTAASAAEALRLLERIPDISLVIASVPPGHVDTDALLARIVRRPAPRPRLILVESHPGEIEALRAAGLGADGYLAKPVLFRDIQRVLRSAEPGSRAEVAYRVRSQPVGLALPRETRADRRSEGAGVVWAIDDLSMTGAFLETQRPLDAGAELELELQLVGADLLVGEELLVGARVVRVQEPCWEHAAGVGVVFSRFADGHAERLRAFIEARREAVEETLSPPSSTAA